MAVIAQIGFEIRAPRGAEAELFEATREAYWDEVAEWDCGLRNGTRAAAEIFLAGAQVSEVVGPVMRDFCPYWPLNGPLNDALDALAELYSETRGFSGFWWYLLDEGCYRYWGEDERAFAALSYDLALRPSWTRYGVHLNRNDLSNILRDAGGAESLSDEDIERLSVALAPKVEELVRATALDLGIVLGIFSTRDRAEISC